MFNNEPLGPRVSRRSALALLLSATGASLLDLKIMPRLAESWEQSSDNTSIKLNLRKGVQFHTGREFTSDDVEYNLMRARDPKNPYAAVVAVGSSWWNSIEKPDKYTIILKSDKPRPGVFDFLQYLRILDKDTMEGPDATTKVVGTGAFKFVEWVPGDHYRYGWPDSQ